MNFDKDKLDDALLGKMRKYINDPEYTPEKVGAVSGAAKGLCQWVHAMFIYGNVAKEVAPKRARLKAAQEALKKKQEALREAEKKLKLVLDKVQALKDTYEVSTSNKKALEDELADLEAKVRVLPFPNPADCVPNKTDTFFYLSPARRRHGHDKGAGEQLVHQRARADLEAHDFEPGCGNRARRWGRLGGWYGER
jgi:hypothetical protein